MRSKKKVIKFAKKYNMRIKESTKIVNNGVAVFVSVGPVPWMQEPKNFLTSTWPDANTAYSEIYHILRTMEKHNGVVFDPQATTINTGPK